MRIYTRKASDIKKEAQDMANDSVDKIKLTNKDETIRIFDKVGGQLGNKATPEIVLALVYILRQAIRGQDLFSEQNVATLLVLPTEERKLH